MDLLFPKNLLVAFYVIFLRYALSFEEMLWQCTKASPLYIDTYYDGNIIFFKRNLI